MLQPQMRKQTAVTVFIQLPSPLPEQEKVSAFSQTLLTAPLPKLEPSQEVCREFLDQERKAVILMLVVLPPLISHLLPAACPEMFLPRPVFYFRGTKPL